MKDASAPQQRPPRDPNLFGVLRPYLGMVTLLVLCAFVANGLNLVIPQIMSRGIDAYAAGTFDLRSVLTEFAVASLLIFVFTYFQSVVQVRTSERVARDLRRDAATKVSAQSYAYIEEATPGKLLTNLTSDVDAVKTFVSLAVVSIVSSLFLIIGSAVLLLMINWRLALAVLLIVPLIGGTFFFVFRKVRTLFKRAQEVIDRLNKVINESILGSALIRVVNAQQSEFDKFLAANSDAKDIGFSMLRLFAAMIPIITFVANAAAVVILALGGHFVIAGSMTLGEFAAFNAYVNILIFPIIMLGFMSNIIARATPSYKRITDVLGSETRVEKGEVAERLRGDIELKDVSLVFGEKNALKNVSFSVKGGSKTAIIGPTAAGKTQVLYLLTGLTRPTSGEILYDGRNVDAYDKESLHRQIGFVFQDSIIFNMSLRENIAFSQDVSEEDMKRAIETAELGEFIASLPQGLETVVSERGTSLSGGQKQRVMLARALALNPRILLLDDFTARVDARTEQSILANVSRNYPDLTLVSITQKISSVEGFDRIILLMEGELLASGTHAELLHSSPEYAQIDQSQRSTHRYELQPE